MTTRTIRGIVGIVQAGLVALVFLTPLPFGSVGPGAVFGIQLLALLLGALAIAIVWLDPSYLPQRARRLLLPIAGLLLLATIQLIPFGSSWAGVAGAQAAELRGQVGATVSIDPPRTAHFAPPAGLDALLRFGSYVWIGFAAAVALRTRMALRTIAVAIALSAGFQGLYGSFEMLSGRQQIFGYVKEFYTHEATGTFINRNHFAGYLAMALPMALALLVRPLSGRRSTGWRERIVRLTEPVVLLPTLAALIAAVIWTGVLLSYSRAGLGVALVATAVLAFGQWRRRGIAWILLASLAIPVAFVSYQQVRAPGERLVRLADDLALAEGRIPVWGAAVSMANDHPLLGTGFGSFDSALPLYSPPTLSLHWQHAHNDWLQAASEGGWAAPLLILLLVVQLLRRGPRSSSADLLAIQLAASAGITAFALHCAVDFPARIPAIAVLAAILCGLRCATLVEPPERETVPK